MKFDDELGRESENEVSVSEPEDDEYTEGDGAGMEDDEEEISKKKTSVESMTRWTKLFALLILVIGCVASAGFLYVGIKAVQDDQDEQFIRNAADLSQRIESAWNDYEVAGLWIHEACRSRSFSRADFLVLYEYLISGGLDFQAAEFIPNVTHEEREASEAESKAYFQEQYPDIVNYVGYRGL